MPKHVPLRSCVACRQQKPKRSLVRVVRTLAGAIEADPTGKKAGRGAYLCATRTCWEQALKKRLLERALKSPISLESRLGLEEYARSLAAPEPAGEG